MEPFKTFLEKLSTDVRDFSHHKVFGSVLPPLVDFDISPLPPIILNQYFLDFCTGFGSSELNTNMQSSDLSLVDYLNSKKMNPGVLSRANLALKYQLVKTLKEYTDMVNSGTNGEINLKILANLIHENGDYFDPLYQFSKIKQVRGEYAGFGANLRDAMQALVKFGSLKKNQSPFTFAENKPTDKDRDFLANWNNWPKNLDIIAALNKIASFFVCDGPYDAFDNIRSVLYTNYKTNLRIGVLFGLNWRPEWSEDPDGILPEAIYAQSAGSPHCTWLRGQKVINGIPYLKLQQSGGEDMGDRGIYYLPRSVVNKEFAANYGAFTGKNMSPKTAGFLIENGLSVNDNWLKGLWKIAWNFVSDIIKTFKHD